VRAVEARRVAVEPGAATRAEYVLVAREVEDPAHVEQDGLGTAGSSGGHDGRIYRLGSA
jgi:hypothetical protein